MLSPGPEIRDPRAHCACPAAASAQIVREFLSALKLAWNMQGYYDNRYWTMWKLPMFGCSDPHQVLAEVDACKRAFSDSYIRLVAFDNIAQCQTISFLVHRPPSARDYQMPEQRSVA
jgi:ribulose bisphosphate carboxylase small subunit